MGRLLSLYVAVGRTAFGLVGEAKHLLPLTETLGNWLLLLADVDSWRQVVPALGEP